MEEGEICPLEVATKGVIPSRKDHSIGQVILVVIPLVSSSSTARRKTIVLVTPVKIPILDIGVVQSSK